MRDELAILKRDICPTFQYTGGGQPEWLGPWECDHGTKFRARDVYFGQYMYTPTFLLQQVHSHDKLEKERFNEWEDLGN